jgi:hypothetical protein
MLTLFIVAAASLQATSGAEDHSHLQKCAKTCADCQVVCDAWFKHCQTLAGKGNTKHTKTAQYCIDCAECCKVCASLCSRQSPLAKHMLELSTWPIVQKRAGPVRRNAATLQKWFIDDSH